MPLTVRTNGSAGPNIITASWFNDYYNLLTGSMQDQPVTLKTNLVLQQISASTPGAITLALAAGTNLGIGVYKYLATFVSGNGGESLAGTSANITTTTGNQAVNLSAIPTGPTGTTARNLYRTAVGGSVFKLLHQIADNTTTTYADTTADGSLGTQNPPTDTSFGGSLFLQTAAAVVTAFIKSNGAAQVAWLSTLDPAPGVVNGGVSGTSTIYQPLRGDIKLVVVMQSNFKTSTSAQNQSIPVPFLNGCFLIDSDVSSFSLLSAGTVENADVFTGLASGGGSHSNVASVGNWSLGFDAHPSDTAQWAANNSTAHTGVLILIGV